MISILRRACLALLMVAAACDSPLHGDSGRLSGHFADAPWNGAAGLCAGPDDRLNLFSEMASPSARRTIWVQVHSLVPGSYPIPAQGAGYQSAPRGGGDAYVATATGGTLVIQSLANGVVRGSLEITMRGTGGETLTFSGGAFVVPEPRRL